VAEALSDLLVRDDVPHALVATVEGDGDMRALLDAIGAGEHAVVRLDAAPRRCKRGSSPASPPAGPGSTSSRPPPRGWHP
jgi:hypothetical protein